MRSDSGSGKPNTSNENNVINYPTLLREANSNFVLLKGNLNLIYEGNPPEGYLESLRGKELISALIDVAFYNKFNQTFGELVGFFSSIPDEKVKLKAGFISSLDLFNDILVDMGFSLTHFKAKDRVLQENGGGDNFAELFLQVFIPRVDNLRLEMERAVEKLKLVFGEDRANRFKTELNSIFKEFYKDLDIAYIDETFNLYFSQDHHSPKFSESGHDFQDADRSITHGRSLEDVKNILVSDPLQVHRMPVSVFPLRREGEDRLYVVNNRTFTAMSRAKVCPTRIVPCLPTQENINFLEKMYEENINDAGMIIYEESEAIQGRGKKRGMGTDALQNIPLTQRNKELVDKLSEFLNHAPEPAAPAASADDVDVSVRRRGGPR